jgi:hypothetical protein
MAETQPNQEQNLFLLIGELKGMINSLNAKLDVMIAGAQKDIVETKQAVDSVREDVEKKNACWQQTFATIEASREITRQKRDKDRETIENKIGEVPSNKTVMQCVRDANDKVNKIYIIAGVFATLYVVISPFLNPFIRSIFNIGD